MKRPKINEKDAGDGPFLRQCSRRAVWELLCLPVENERNVIHDFSSEHVGMLTRVTLRLYCFFCSCCCWCCLLWQSCLYVCKTISDDWQRTTYELKAWHARVWVDGRLCVGELTERVESTETGEPLPSPPPSSPHAWRKVARLFDSKDDPNCLKKVLVTCWASVWPHWAIFKSSWWHGSYQK